MDKALQETLIEYLNTLATPERQERIDQVLSERTRHITVVLEDLYQPHNISAVMRSCEGLGIQDIHTIENKNSFTRTRKIDMGSQKWLTLHRHRSADQNTSAALQSLKDQGYQLIATTPPSDQSVQVNDFVPTQKCAILFGTELTGLSDEAFRMADVHMTIPMYGFVESFNISVSCAIILQQLTSKLRGSSLEWKLSSEEIESLRFHWLLQSVAHGDKMVAHYIQETLGLDPQKIL